VEGHEPPRAQAATIRGVRGRVLIAVAAAVLAAGCGGNEEGGSGSGGAEKPKLETDDSGTRTIKVIDAKAGLEIEIQNDGLGVKATADAPEATRALEGELLGGSCEDDGKEGVEAAAQFPVYWREEYGDWGSALAREDNLGKFEVYESPEEYDKAKAKPVLAEHVTSCKLFKTEPTGEPDQVVFDAENDTPLATATFR